MLHRRLARTALKTVFTDFDHRLIAKCRELGLVRKKLVVAVSGGADSMALLCGLHRCNPVLKNELIVAHVHHGTGGSASQARYREIARRLVRVKAEELGLMFLTQRRPTKGHLRSEEELRNYRHEWLERWREENNADFTVTAHHAGDLLETQLLRLIRGTSALGLCAMRPVAGRKARPLLDETSEGIRRWVRRMKIDYIEDPSNKNTDPLRNWLRHKWLPALDRKQKGAKTSLSRSLKTICEELSLPGDQELMQSALRGAALARTELIRAPKTLQKSVLAAFLRSKGVRNYTQGQLEEILRRLDNPRGEFTFTVLKHRWRVNAGLIHVEPWSSLL